MSSKYNPRECKRVFGVMICQFKSGFVAAFPAESKVDVNVFTTENCVFCKPVVKQIKKMSKQLKDVININVITLDNDWDKYPDIKGAPTVQIGGDRFTGIPDQSQLWASIFNNINIDRSGGSAAAAATVL